MRECSVYHYLQSRSMLRVHVEDQHEFFTQPSLSCPFLQKTRGAGDGRNVRVLGMVITSKISYYGWNNEALSGQVSKLRGNNIHTGFGKSTNPRFCENEVKKLHSSACCRQENATFYPLILGTWGLWIFRSLYRRTTKPKAKLDSALGQEPCIINCHVRWITAFAFASSVLHSFETEVYASSNHNISHSALIDLGVWLSRVNTELPTGSSKGNVPCLNFPLLLPMNSGWPMHSQSALTELSSPNLAHFLFLDPVETHTALCCGRAVISESE